MKFNAIMSAVRSVVAPLSPRRRQWNKFLQSLQLNPDELVTPLEEPSGLDFIICGTPRSGTTLLNAMLFQPPQVLTVMEPWDGMRLPPAPLFAKLRNQIDNTSQLAAGKLDVEALQSGRQVQWTSEGATRIEVKIAPDYLLGIKWPAYWRFLSLLPNTKFLVCIRHPFETINSFKQVGGRLRQGLEYDIAFHQRMNQQLVQETSNESLRRILLYERINQEVVRYMDRPNVLIVRYERWFEDPEQLIAEIEGFLNINLNKQPAAIRPSSHPLDLSPEEIRLIQQECHSARLLGYNLIPEANMAL